MGRPQAAILKHSSRAGGTLLIVTLPGNLVLANFAQVLRINTGPGVTVSYIACVNCLDTISRATL
jgi:hypothetical protein